MAWRLFFQDEEKKIWAEAQEASGDTCTYCGAARGDRRYNVRAARGPNAPVEEEWVGTRAEAVVWCEEKFKELEAEYKKERPSNG